MSDISNKDIGKRFVHYRGGAPVTPAANKMVERVARALQMPMVDTSVGMTPMKRLELMARAAIEAMREPTDEMCRSAERFGDSEGFGAIGDYEAKRVWQDMVNTIIPEK